MLLSHEVFLLKIVMLTQAYPPILGGIEKHVQRLSHELVKRKHEVVVITLWNESTELFEEDQGVRVYRIKGIVHRLSSLLFSDANRSYSPPFPDPELTSQIFNILKREEPDIVHAHNWLIHAYLPIKHKLQVPLIATMHDYHLVCTKWNLIYRSEICDGPTFRKCLDCSLNNYGLTKGSITFAATRFTMSWEHSLVDYFIAVSNAVALHNNLNADKVSIIPNFIEDQFATITKQDEDLVRQLPDGDFLLFAGAFARSKGVEVLLQAYRELDLDSPPPLVMIGYDTADFPDGFIDLPENVHVFHNWTHLAVLEAWKKCLIAIVPSIWYEPCPTVVMEAMMMRRPVIGTRLGGIPDLIVHEKTGLLVEPNNPHALRDTIIRLINDDDLRASMADAGIEHIQKFKASAVVPQIEAVYESMLIAR